MSRIGKLPIALPSNVEIKLDGQFLEAKGPKGTLSYKLPDYVSPEVNENILEIKPRKTYVEQAEKKIQDNDAKGRKKITFAEALDPIVRTFWGTTRSRCANIVEGVTTGFSKTLELHGVGYRAQMKGQSIRLALGFSHDVVFDPPEGIKLSTPSATEIVVEGIDKQVVGQVAAVIRGYRPPEPYKGKGVRYRNEYVRRKEGKKK